MTRVTSKHIRVKASSRQKAGESLAQKKRKCEETRQEKVKELKMQTTRERPWISAVFVCVCFFPLIRCSCQLHRAHADEIMRTSRWWKEEKLRWKENSEESVE